MQVKYYRNGESQQLEAALDRFEKRTRQAYPFSGTGRMFIIDHGEHYLRFFKLLGTPHIFVMEDSSGEIVASLIVVERPSQEYTGVSVYYFCDLKVDPSIRGRGLASRLFMACKKILFAENKPYFVYAINMTGSRRDEFLAQALEQRMSPSIERPFGSNQTAFGKIVNRLAANEGITPQIIELGFYMITIDQLQLLKPIAELIDHYVNPIFHSLRGIKSLYLQEPTEEMIFYHCSASPFQVNRDTPSKIFGPLALTRIKSPKKDTMIMFVTASPKTVLFLASQNIYPLAYGDLYKASNVNLDIPIEAVLSTAEI